jgi:hypothetical protein
MKHLNLLLIMFCTIYFSKISAQKTEEIISIAWVYKPHLYYVQQSEAWNKQIEEDKSNADAWYNYYKANRYAKMTAEDEEGKPWREKTKWLTENKHLMELSDIEEAIKINAPESYAYYSVKYWNYGMSFDHPKSIELLNKAYNLNPDNPDILEKFVVYYDVKREIEKRKEFNQKWFKLYEFSPGMLNYHYNVLMSLDENAIILTNGDSPTMAIWMLQDALNIRPDVTVFCVSLFQIDEYRESLFTAFSIPELKVKGNETSNESVTQIIDHIFENKPDNVPLYVSLQLWNQEEKHSENLYLVGLALEYSRDEIDNLAKLKMNFNDKYALDYIKVNFSNDRSIDYVNYDNFNYIPGLVKLYKHFIMSGEIKKAMEMKELGFLIVNKLGDEYKLKAEEAFN